MKPFTRLALIASLVAGLTLSLGASARADHQFGHDHPFCAQGGGQDGASSGGPGGTQFNEAAATHFSDTGGGGEPPDTVLVPRHLAARFGEDDPRGIDADAQFIEVGTSAIEDSGGGSNGGAFHGGHGGGPGGGQGGSTFFGAGDGGCSPEFEEVRRVPTQPGRRLPVTGGLAEQLGLMSGLMLSLGWLLSMVSRRRAPLAVDAGEGLAVPTVRRGRQVVSRLKEQVVGSWKVGG